MKNVFLYRFRILTTLLIAVSIVAVGCIRQESSIQQGVSPQDAQQISYDATVYGFPLVIMELTRQIPNGSPHTR